MSLRCKDSKQCQETGRMGSPNETASLEDHKTSEQEYKAAKGYHSDLDISHVEAWQED